MSDYKKYVEQARDYADTYNLSFDFFSRIINQESSWRADAINPATGAVGFGQLMKPAVDDWNADHATMYRVGMLRYHPDVNLKISAWYLGVKIPEYLQNYGIPVDEYHVAWAYNAGIGYVVGGIMPTETRNYIKNVGAKKKRNIHQIPYVDDLTVYGVSSLILALPPYK